MKSFSVFQLSGMFLLLAIHSVQGKIPDYIHICKANDPEISKCIQSSILSLRDKLAEGIPELEVPALNSIYFDKLSLNLGPGFKAEGRNLTITGAQNFQFNDYVANITANVYTMDLTIPELIVSGTYAIDAKIAVIPLKGRGPMRLLSRNIRVRATLRGKKVVRGGKTYQWYSGMSIKLEFNDYEVKLDNLFGGDPTIGEVTNNLLNQEKAEILAILIPEFERLLIEYVLRTSNNICKHFTWEELFPES